MDLLGNANIQEGVGNLLLPRRIEPPKRSEDIASRFLQFTMALCTPAFYMLSGDELEVWTGDQLQFRDIVHPGDYLYIPANVLHVAVNRGTQPAVFVGARNEPTAQESVVMYPEMDARVP